MLAVGAANPDRNLAGMRRSAQQQRSVMVRVRQAHEQRPPVEHQRDEARHEAAPLQVLGREATSAPSVLQLVEVVLGIAAVAVELSEREDFSMGV